MSRDDIPEKLFELVLYSDGQISIWSIRDMSKKEFVQMIHDIADGFDAGGAIRLY